MNKETGSHDLCFWCVGSNKGENKAVSYLQIKDIKYFPRHKLWKGWENAKSYCSKIRKDYIKNQLDIFRGSNLDTKIYHIIFLVKKLSYLCTPAWKHRLNIQINSK